MPLNNIARIEAPPLKDFLRKYVRTATPVIITNLFDQARIRRIDTIDRAHRQLGDVGLEIQPNYIAFLETGVPGARRRMTLRDYLDHVREQPATADLCVEFDTPEPLRSLIPAPDYCDLNDPSDIVSATFVANAGNFNHLHVDDDLRDVLLYQVFGTKRFAIIHPREGRKLDAFLTMNEKTSSAIAATPSRDANGRVFLEDLTEDDKAAFLRYLNARDSILCPGETLFIPALSWHYVEYHETSMSVTYRLGRTPLTRMIANAVPQPTVFLQEVLAKLHDEEAAQRRYPDILRSLEDACSRALDTEQQRMEAAHAEIVKAYDKLFPESAQSVALARALYQHSLMATNGAPRSRR